MPDDKNTDHTVCDNSPAKNEELDSFLNGGPAHIEPKKSRAIVMRIVGREKGKPTLIDPKDWW